MLVVTNYPQVPIATSNVATDSARVDNQQRPPIIPPQETTKGHEERNFNAQNERTEQALSKNLERVNQKQQRQESDQHQQHQQKGNSQADQMLAQLRKRLPAKPALERKDIQVAATPAAAAKQASASNNSHLTEVTRESFNLYQAFGERIGSFYQQQIEANDEPMLSDWI